jgi:hypothetical protein
MIIPRTIIALCLVGLLGMSSCSSDKDWSAIEPAETRMIQEALELFKASHGRYPNQKEGLKSLREPTGDLKWDGPYLASPAIIADFRYSIDKDGVPNLVYIGPYPKKK